MFTIYNDYGADATLVPNLFIDEYMKNANDAQIKIYLYLLRMMGSRRAASITDMAEKFNHTEREVLRSLRYWEKQGLLTLEYDEDGYLAGIHLCEIHPKSPAQKTSSPSRVISLSAEHVSYASEVSSDSHGLTASEVSSGSPVSSGSEVFPASHGSAAAASVHGATKKMSSANPNADVSGKAPAPAFTRESGAASAENASRPRHEANSSQAAAEPSSVSDRFTSERHRTGRRRKTSQAALEAYRSNEDRAQLLFIIEQYIGKPLSVNEMQVVYYISEELKFSDSLIDYLVQYCVDRGKKDFRYIEKVAVNWSEHGITTPKQAERAASSGKRNGVWSGSSAGSNKFNQFEQNRYDFDKLEQEILNN